MDELLRQRLAHASGDAGAHPDADVLTAYAEQSLGLAEREQVMVHLAACAECRDVVALASPAAVVEAAPRLTLPFLAGGAARWVAAAAAVVVLSAAVLLRTPEKGNERGSYIDPPPAESSRPSAGQSTDAVPAAPSAREQSDQRHKSGENKRAERKEKSAKLPAGGGVVSGVGAGIGAPVPKDQLASRAGERALADSPVPQPTPAPPAAQDAIAETAVVTAPPPPAPASEPVRPDRQEARESIAAQTASAPEAANKAKSEQVSVLAAPAQNTRALGMRPGVAMTASQASGYRWRISGDAKLERSADGRTWSAAPGLPQEARFRTVAELGSTVWAGGEAGMVARSVSQGASWDVVRVPGLASTVEGILLASPDEVTLFTTDAVFSTANGGKSWTRTARPPERR